MQRRLNFAHFIFCLFLSKNKITKIQQKCIPFITKIKKFSKKGTKFHVLIDSLKKLYKYLIIEKSQSTLKCGTCSVSYN